MLLLLISRALQHISVNVESCKPCFGRLKYHLPPAELHVVKGDGLKYNLRPEN